MKDPREGLQERVTIDGKEFRVFYEGYDESTGKVFIDLDTLFSTKLETVFLDDGCPVILGVGLSVNLPYTRSISELREQIKLREFNSIRRLKREEFERCVIDNLDMAYALRRNLGEQKLYTRIRCNGTALEQTVYGCMFIDDKGDVKLSITTKKELSEESTKRAINVLFMRHIEKNYNSHRYNTKGVLTGKEKIVKREFDAFVKKKILPRLTVSNVRGAMVMAEDYFCYITGKK